MSTLVALNSQIHRALTVNAEQIELQAGLLHMVPVVLTEFHKLSLQYPIVVTKNKDTGRFVCSTLFGLEKGENLFLNNDKWDSLYLPLHIRRQPFFIGNSAGEGEQPVICIDMCHPSVGVAGGERLFDDRGGETDYLLTAKNILTELFEGKQATQLFIDEILTLNLLQPMQLQITLIDGRVIRVEGLYAVDEDALNKLSAEQVIALHKNNYLHPIYTMITSVGHIYGLVDKKNKALALLNADADS